MEVPNDLLVQFGSLVGLGALIAVIVNLLKYTGLIKDGDSLKWATAFNAVGFVVFMGVGIFQPELLAENVAEVDSLAYSLANVIGTVLAFIIQVASSPAIHGNIRGVPLIGKSFPGDFVWDFGEPDEPEAGEGGE